MRIFLRVCFHALLLFIALQIFDAAISHAGSPVLERILYYLGSHAYTIFCLTAATTANGQRALLAGIIVLLALIAIPLAFPVALRMATSMVGGVAFGLVLQSLVRDATLEQVGREV